MSWEAKLLRDFRERTPPQPAVGKAADDLFAQGNGPCDAAVIHPMTCENQNHNFISRVLS